MHEAIQSVLNQTWRDWELLLVDDGSTDASSAIAVEAAQANPDRVRLLQHDGGVNRGMSASRNLGLGEAAGEWVSFIDGDDLWKQTKLERQLSLLAEHPGVDVLVSPAQWWYGSDGQLEDFVQRLNCTSDSVVAGQDLVVGFLRDEWASLCDIVARTSVVMSVGGYEDSFDGMFEDQVFHSKLLLSRPVLVTGDWWYRYRQHEATSTSQAHRAGQHRKARIRYLSWLQRYLGLKLGFASALRVEVLAKLLRLRFPVFTLARRAVGSMFRRLRAVRANHRRTAP